MDGEAERRIQQYNQAPGEVLDLGGANIKFAAEFKQIQQSPETLILSRNHISEVQLADAFSGLAVLDVSCNALETFAGIERA